jgi:predicted HNH restriction endonuclease
VVQGLGRHCLVFHHKKQLRDTDQMRETGLSDLAVLCGNRHLLVHANPEGRFPSRNILGA